MKNRIIASLLTIAALCSSLSIMPVHAAYHLETWTDMEYIETYGMLEFFASPYAGLDYAVYTSSANGRPDWFVDVFKDRFGFILAENVGRHMDYTRIYRRAAEPYNDKADKGKE